jgi:hypothetical protein
MRTVPFWDYHGIFLGVLVVWGAVVAPRTVIFSKLLFGALGTSLAASFAVGNTPSAIPFFLAIVAATLIAPRAMLALGATLWFSDNTFVYFLVLVLAFLEHYIIRGMVLPNIAGFASHELGRTPPCDVEKADFRVFGKPLGLVGQLKVIAHYLIALVATSLPYAPPSWLKHTDELAAAHKKRSVEGGEKPRRNTGPWWEVLGLSSTASLDEAKKKFHEIAKKHHPDTNDGKGDPEAMRSAIEAMNEARKEKNG